MKDLFDLFRDYWFILDELEDWKDEIDELIEEFDIDIIDQSKEQTKADIERLANTKFEYREIDKDYFHEEEIDISEYDTSLIAYVGTDRIKIVVFYNK